MDQSACDIGLFLQFLQFFGFSIFWGFSMYSFLHFPWHGSRLAGANRQTVDGSLSLFKIFENLKKSLAKHCKFAHAGGALFWKVSVWKRQAPFIMIPRHSRPTLSLLSTSTVRASWSKGQRSQPQGEGPPKSRPTNSRARKGSRVARRTMWWRFSPLSGRGWKTVILSQASKPDRTASTLAGGRRPARPCGRRSWVSFLTAIAPISQSGSQWLSSHFSCCESKTGALSRFIRAVLK